MGDYLIGKSPPTRAGQNGKFRRISITHGLH
jgi:hypothetical protein